MNDGNFPVFPVASTLKEFVEQDFKETEARIACNSYNLNAIHAFDPAPYLSYLYEVNGVN